MMKAQISEGVVRNIITVDPDDIPGWCADWPTVTGVGVGWTYDGETFSAPTPPAPTNDQVNAERDRRLLAGTTATLVGYPDPVVIGGDPVTIRNLQALAFGAQLRLAQGQDAVTPYRDETDTIHSLSSAQVIDLWQQGATYVSALFQAAWTLKDNPGGIPADYAADVNWP